MAYTLRYYKTLPQPGDRDIVLEIYEKDGVRSSMEIGPVIQALHLDIQGSQEDIDTPVVKTSLVMTFVDAPDHEEASSKKCGNWEEFYTSDSTYWKVVLKKRTASGSFSPIWGGYVTPDSFTEQLRYRGSVTIVARDNIGHMQDFPFDSKGNEDGMITVYDLVNTAWAKIESPMSLNWRGEEDEAMWLQCDGHDVTGAYLNVSAFKGMNWYEAMEKVLYSIGAVMRYVGDNTVQVSSLRYMPYQGSASMSSLAEIEPKFIAHANRELVPAVRRIEESVKYDLVEDMQPLVSSEDFSGAVSDAAWGAYTAPVWPLINTASGNGWGNAVPSSAMYFNPQAYAIDEPPFLPAFEQMQEDIYNSMYLLCDAGQAMAEYSRGVTPANMSYHMRLGHTIQLYGSDTSGYVIVPSLAKIYRIRYAVKVTEARVEYFLQSDGSWSQDYAELEAYNDGNDCRELNGMLNLGQFSGGMVLHLYVTGIESDAAGLAITYASVQMLSFAASEGEAYLQTNHINTVNDESNNVILSHDPAFGPAYNLVALPGIIKNGMFIKSGDVYLPAKAWAWSGGTPQQMAVYNHLQILCYHAKPNNVITGDIVNADLGNLRALYMWHGSEHLLQGGSLNFLNGRIEGAILREFARYDDMWGDVTGDSMPATEQESSTNVEEGGSSSGSSATYENTTNVTIGGSGGGSVTVDTFLSDTSTNPVQNRAIKAYVDSVDNLLDEKIGNLAEHIDAVDNTFIFSYDSTTNKATAEMVAGLASAITVNKLIVCNGRTYKFILEQDGMYGLVSDAYMDITDGKLKTSILAVTASSYDVQLMEQEVPTGTEITESTVAGWGFTKNAGTITGIKMNGVTKGTSGVVDLGNVLTEHQQLKTINGQSIVGEGNITIQGGGATPRVEMTETSAAIEPNKFYVWPIVDALDLTLGAEQSGVMNRYLFQFRNPKAGLTMLTLPDDITWSEDTELDENGMPVMEATAFYRIEIIEGLASLKKWKLAYIQFADAEVERVLMANGIGDGIGITKKDAAAVTQIGSYFMGNTNIESFNEFAFFIGIVGGVGNSTTYNQAFKGCTALREIAMPVNATEVYDANVTTNGMFNGCTALAKVNMEYIVKIGAYTFYGCTSLAEVAIDWSKVIKIGAFAFWGCTSLVVDEMNLESLEIFGRLALSGVRVKMLNLGKTTVLPSVALVEDDTYGAKSVLERVIIPEGVTSIPTYSFANYEVLKTINFPDSLASIGVQAFYYCTALEGDVVVNNVTTIGNSAFNHAVKITALMASSIISIGIYVFDACAGMTRIILGENVASIGNGAFRNCTALLFVIVRNSTPPTLGTMAFNGSTCPIYVPDASVEAYKAANNWSSYASRIKGISEYTG